MGLLIIGDGGDRVTRFSGGGNTSSSGPCELFLQVKPDSIIPEEGNDT